MYRASTVSVIHSFSLQLISCTPCANAITNLINPLTGLADNYEVNIGEDVHIPCTASGVPKPDIIWTKMNSQTNETSFLNVQGGILSLENARQNQSGNYMCTVFNGARRFVRKTHVLVIVPPNFITKTAKSVTTPENDFLRQGQLQKSLEKRF